jgi:hypothetical protein
VAGLSTLSVPPWTPGSRAEVRGAELVLECWAAGLGGVDELQRLVGDLDADATSGVVGQELAQHDEVVIKTQPSGFAYR